MLTHLKKRICAMINFRWRHIRKAKLIINAKWRNLDVSTFERKETK